MKTWKILLICFAVLFAVVIGSNIWNGERRQLPAQTPESVTATPTPPPEVIMISRMGDVMHDTVPDDWTVSWTYDPETRTAWFIFVDPAITPELIQTAQKFPEETSERWESNKNSMIELQKEISKDLELNGYKDITVVLELRNPENTEEPWLIVANGIAGYDVVSGIDLRGGQG